MQLKLRATGRTWSFRIRIVSPQKNQRASENVKILCISEREKLAIEEYREDR